MHDGDNDQDYDDDAGRAFENTLLNSIYGQNRYKTFGGGRSPKEPTNNFPSPIRHDYWNFTPDQIHNIVKAKFDSSIAKPLHFVILNTFVVDPRIDLPLDREKEKFWSDHCSIFILAKVVEDLNQKTNLHDKKAIIRLVKSNNLKQPSHKKAEEFEINNIIDFQQTLPKIDFHYPGISSLTAESPTESCLTLHEPYIDISTREFRSDEEIKKILMFINDKIAKGQSLSSYGQHRIYSKFATITRFARLTPNVVHFDSVKGFGKRHYYTPRSIYGYQPDNEYDPNFFRIWISSKELVSSIVKVFETFEFNDTYGSFRVFSDQVFDTQWRTTFNIQITNYYSTKHYRTMAPAFKERYFRDVGTIDLSLPENDESNTEPLFLDVEFDSFISPPTSFKPKSDYSVEGLCFDTETENKINTITGKPRFSIPYVNAHNLERSVSKKILHDESQRQLELKKDRMCPKCPFYYKGHENCRKVLPEDVEKVETQNYIKELTKAIQNDKVLSEIYPNVDPSVWIPDPKTGTDQVLCICFVVANVRDTGVVHPCDAYSHYILTHKPKLVEKWKIDIDIIRGSKRLKDTNIRVCNSELDMILKFAEYIRQTCPMMILGYNSHGFDIPYLEQRIKWYSEFGTSAEQEMIERNPFNIGLLRFFSRPHQYRYVTRPNLGRRLVTTVFPSLLKSIDVIEGIGNETFSQPSKMASYKLNSVAAASLLYPETTEPMLKIKLDVTKGIEMWREGNSAGANFMGYCVWDAILTLGLYRNFGFDELSDTIARLSGLQPGLVFPTGVRDKIIGLYHNYNAQNKGRYLIPVEKGGLMILMHHPDIWMFSPSRCHDENLKENPYKEHRICPKSDLIIPNVFEVVERRKYYSWLKGSQRNFPKNVFTPTDSICNEKFVYGSRFSWSAREKLTFDKEKILKEMAQPWCDRFEKAAIQSIDDKMDIDSINDDDNSKKTPIDNVFKKMSEGSKTYDPSMDKKSSAKIEKENQEKAKHADLNTRSYYETKVKELENIIKNFDVALREILNGETSMIKYARSRLHHDMRYYQDELKKNQQNLREVIVQEAIRNSTHSLATGSFVPFTFRQNFIGDLNINPKKYKSEYSKYQEKIKRKVTSNNKKSKDAKPYIGGFVMNMIRGYFEEFVIFSDFNSLYPSIMVSNYIDFSNLLTQYVRTSVYPNISPFSFKKVVLGPYKDIFNGDYCYDPDEAKLQNYDTAELAETSWIQDPDCLTTIIMDSLLKYRNQTKEEMNVHIALKHERSFEQFVRDFEGKPLTTLIERLEDPKFLNSDYDRFGKDKMDAKSKFLKHVRLKPIEPDELCSLLGVDGKHAKYADSITKVKMMIIIHKNQESTLNSRQNGIKVMMNSGYGFLGSKVNLNLPEGAATITSIGRRQIQIVNIIVENMSVLKIMVKNCNLGNYLITLGIHPGVWYPEMIPENPSWPPIEEKHLEAADMVCIREKALGGDTDSGFAMVSKTLISPENMNDPVYPTKVKLNELGEPNGYYIDYNDKPRSKYDMVKEFANFQSLTIIQSFLPIEFVTKDCSYYDMLVEDKSKENELLLYKLFNHQKMQKLNKQRMVVEKISDRFLGFGKKRYSYTNCEIKKLLHKGISLVRGDSVPWVSNRLKKALNDLFRTTPIPSTKTSMDIRSTLFKGEPLSESLVLIVKIFVYIIEELENLALGKNIDINEFELSQKLKKDTSMYAVEQPHVRVARKMIQRGDNNIGPQSTIRYVFYFRYGTDSSGSIVSSSPVFNQTLNAKRNASHSMVTLKIGKGSSSSQTTNSSTQKTLIESFFQPSNNNVSKSSSISQQSNLVQNVSLNRQSLFHRTQQNGSSTNLNNRFKATLATMYSFDITKLNMTDGKPTNLQLPDNFNLLNNESVKDDVDTASEVIENGYMLNIPKYIYEKIIPSIAIILSPLICGNDEYPQIDDITDKEKEEAIEGAQKTFVAEQRRQVEVLLWTKTLKSRTNKMFEWYKSKTLLSNGQVPFNITSKCMQCDEYFEYRAQQNLGNYQSNRKNQSSILEICPKCKESGSAIETMKIRKQNIILSSESEYMDCMKKCEKCILRGEVSIIPEGILNDTTLGPNDEIQRKWSGTKEELIQKMCSTGSHEDDIEDLHKMVTLIPKMKYLNYFSDFPPLVELNHSNIQTHRSVYSPKIWIANPLDCKDEDCKTHKQRRTLFLRHKQAKHSLKLLDNSMT